MPVVDPSTVFGGVEVPFFEGTFIPTQRSHPIVQQDSGDDGSSLLPGSQDIDELYDSSDLTGFDRIDEVPWYMVFTQVKYILNIVLIAVPWTLFGLINIAWNVWLNLYFNQGWAGANVWLIANTAYLVFQYVLSIGLFWEIDIWIYYMKFIRILSLVSAYLYSIVYALGIVTLMVIAWDLDGAEVTWVGMMTAMVVSYNLILHAPIMLINFGIVGKEFSMEFIQLANDWAGTGLDDWSLGAHNVVDLAIAMSNWLNPWWWFAPDDGDKWDDMYE